MNKLLFFLQEIFTLLEQNKFQEVDNLFLEINPKDLEKSVVLLRITFPIKNKFNNRSLFLTFIKYTLLKEKLNYAKILQGLLDE